MKPPRSPISVDTARRLTAYNERVFRRYVRAAQRLPWRVASANRGTGHQSIFHTLVHILNVHEVWATYIIPGRLGELEGLFRQSYRRPTDWSGFNAYSRKVWSDINRYMESVTTRELGRRVKAPWMRGDYTVGDAVLQTTFEQAHHLGEVIAVSWQRDQEPPQMTWIDVNRARGRPNGPDRRAIR